MIFLRCGDEVAILPDKGSLPSEVLEIAIVSYAGPAIIELTDGRLYHASDGTSFRPQDGCIVPATQNHRTAWRAKLR